MNRHKIPPEDFDAFLTEQLRNSSPYIADEGFTENVLRALPKNSLAGRAGRWLWIAAGIMAGSAAAPLIFTVGTDITQWINQLNTFQLLHLGLVASGITFGSAVLWLVRELDWI